MRYYRQFVACVTRGGLDAAYCDALPWDRFLDEVETAMRLREDLAG